MTEPSAVGSASVEIDREKLRELRQDRGFTQLELAKRAGISAQYLSQLEIGFRVRVSPPKYVALCDALRIPQSRRRMLRKKSPSEQVA